jgi:hypothetical protein
MTGRAMATTWLSAMTGFPTTATYQARKTASKTHPGSKRCSLAEECSAGPSKGGSETDGFIIANASELGKGFYKQAMTKVLQRFKQ